MPREQFGPTPEQIKPQETIEQKRERFRDVITLFTDDGRAVKVADILRGKNIPQLPKYSGGSTIFVAETVQKMTTVEPRDERYKFAAGRQNIETLAYLLRAVNSSDRSLVAEFLALPTEEQHRLGVAFSRTISGKDNPIEIKKHEILDTSGQLMEYLGQATQK